MLDRTASSILGGRRSDEFHLGSVDIWLNIPSQVGYAVRTIELNSYALFTIAIA